jgi:hypothetical protein
VHPVIGRCPICQGDLAVTRLLCQSCGTAVEGEFHLGPLQRLNQEQVRFVESFIRARGSLKDVGIELNMSYPTVNSRLNDILLALGYGDRVKVSEPQEGSLSAERRREILTQVQEGNLSAAEAARMLREKV